LHWFIVGALLAKYHVVQVHTKLQANYTETQTA